MRQERAYLELYAAARYSVAPDGDSGDRLEVYDEAGAQILVFVTAGTGSAALYAAVVAAATATPVLPTPVPPTATPTGFTR
jgi:2-methylisocitrate lyase-like PEP mutase family enzyme